MRAATYAVRAGDTLRERFPLELFAGSKYTIEVHGPNGFYRSFTGDAAAHQIAVAAEYEEKDSELTGNIRVHLRNTSAEPITVAVVDNSYGADTRSKHLRPGREDSVVLVLKRSHGWYDFTVKPEGSGAEARFAGRVETGRSSFSDPLMGGETDL